MTEFTVTMVRSPGITDTERKQRLRQAFDILLEWGKKAAALDTVRGQGQDSDTPIEQGAMQSISQVSAS
ncbi:MAG: hypothetical protein GY832_02460 [Chloroflexi bacterium]|nr:hypothetical protein [Chloroflexota bacterium]